MNWFTRLFQGNKSEPATDHVDPAVEPSNQMSEETVKSRIKSGAPYYRILLDRLVEIGNQLTQVKYDRLKTLNGAADDLLFYYLDDLSATDIEAVAPASHMEQYFGLRAIPTGHDGYDYVGYYPGSLQLNDDVIPLDQCEHIPLEDIPKMDHPCYLSAHSNVPQWKKQVLPQTDISHFTFTLWTDDRSSFVRRVVYLSPEGLDGRKLTPVTIHDLLLESESYYLTTYSWLDQLKAGLQSEADVEALLANKKSNQYQKLLELLDERVERNYKAIRYVFTLKLQAAPYTLEDLTRRCYMPFYHERTRNPDRYNEFKMRTDQVIRQYIIARDLNPETAVPECTFTVDEVLGLLVQVGLSDACCL